MRGRAYCHNCHKKVEFETREESIDVDISGMKFSYDAIVAYCCQCNKEIKIAKLNDLNVIRAYKKQKEILEKEAELEEKKAKSGEKKVDSKDKKEYLSKKEADS